MTLRKLISEKNDRLIKIPNQFLSKVERYQKKLYSQILSLVDSLDRADGFLLPTDKNFTLIIQVVDELKAVLSDSEYSTAVEQFAGEFFNQKTMNDEYLSKTFDDFQKSDTADFLVRKSQVDSVTALLESPLESNFLKPLEELLIDSTASGASWVDTLKSIQDYAIGGDESDGKLLQYAKQIAHDNFAYADRSYTSLLADDLESEWFLYSGGEIATTRCFCKERHEKYFHYKEIEAFGRGENLGSCKVGDLWAGADPNTNEKTIYTYAGGFNCGHSILPVSVFSVPQDVIQRNIDSGNYSPSEKELALLN